MRLAGQKAHTLVWIVVQARIVSHYCLCRKSFCNPLVTVPPTNIKEYKESLCLSCSCNQSSHLLGGDRELFEEHDAIASG